VFVREDGGQVTHDWLLELAGMGGTAAAETTLAVLLKATPPEDQAKFGPLGGQGHENAPGPAWQRETVRGLGLFA
jgi:hypothetical protein